MPHYSNGNGLSYIYDNGQIPYQTVNTPCSTYSRTYAQSHGGSPTALYMPNASAHFQQYPLNGRLPTLPSQSRAYPMIPQYGQSPVHRTSSQHTRLGILQDYGPMDCTVHEGVVRWVARSCVWSGKLDRCQRKRFMSKQRADHVPRWCSVTGVLHFPLLLLLLLLSSSVVYGG